ncbi:MAG: DsrE family protein [Gammaproteobacteria bacterium]|jgi:intracellular sulfur oxidation DsrE/DsrF family protein
MFRTFISLAGVLLLAMVATQSMAAKPTTVCHNGVDPTDGYNLDDEFGTGTASLTRCLADQNKPKVVMQINVACRDSYVAGTAVKNDVGHCSRPYALGNIENMIKDYEGSHGIDNWEIIAVVHSGGWGLLVKDDYTFTNIDGEGGGAPGPKTLHNPFAQDVKDLMDMGVRFLFCQNTTRGMIARGNLPTVNETPGGGGATEALIDGVEYTTAGVTAIADLQTRGYRYVQP